MMTEAEEKIEWVGTRYVADQLGISTGKARKVIEGGNVPIFHVGNRIRVIRKDADLLVERVKTRGWI